MGLLDDAIREHLELKRRRGADASEIAREEQEALGPARRVPTPIELDSSEEETALQTLPEPGEPGTAAASALDEPVAPVESPEPLAEPHDEHLTGEPSEPQDAHIEPAGAFEPTVAYDHMAEGDFGEAPVTEHPPDESTHDPASGLAEERAQAAAADPVSPRPGQPPESDPLSAPPPLPAPPRLPHELAPATSEAGSPGAPAEVAPGARPAAPTSPASPAEAAQSDPGAPEQSEDVLEETPEFLQETPEHDRLWFEQRPPRDFDFDK